LHPSGVRLLVVAAITSTIALGMPMALADQFRIAVIECCCAVITHRRRGRGLVWDYGFLGMANGWRCHRYAEFGKTVAMSWERPIRTRLSVIVVAVAFDAAVVHV